jgi:predicted dehydrogenase
MASAHLVNAFPFKREPLKVGVIGTGSRGKGLMNLIQGMEGMEVVACADIIPFRLEEAKAMGDKIKGYQDHRGVIDDKNVEAVIIATPFSTHDEIAIEALDADKHIYCEKTMVKGMDEIQKVLDKANASNKVFYTGHQYRSSPVYQKVRQIIKSGYIGDITSVECQWNRNADWRRPVPDPKWERMINWRMYREYSGGLVAELLSHQMDFINWFTDSHPSRISGFGGIDFWKDGRETFDNVHVLFEYPNGMDASFMSTTSNAHEGFEMKILARKATIVLRFDKGEIFTESLTDVEKGIVDGVSGATLKTWQEGKGVPILGADKDPTIEALNDFYESVVYQEEPISSVKSGAVAAKCVQISLDALYDGEVKHWSDYPELNM